VSSSLKKYNLSGEEVGTVKVDERLTDDAGCSQLVKDYIVALQANARAWLASTKGRSEVAHTTKKPHPQKGTGRARQGSLVAPQYRGGGRVFGPKPKFGVSVKINAKSKRMAIRMLVAKKIVDGRVHIVDTLAMDAPKTQRVSNFLETRGIERRALFIGEGSRLEIGGKESGFRVSVASLDHENFKLSMRNIPEAEFSLATDIDGYRVARAHDLVISEAALGQLEEWLLERAE
jgi:large subunit ribosomal protein L4